MKVPYSNYKSLSESLIDKFCIEINHDVNIEQYLLIQTDAKITLHDF